MLPWISRGLEGLWLLAGFLVPLIFLGQDYAISEARIAYVEVPKVALLRTLAGLIALIWVIEWAIKSRAFQDFSPSNSIQTLAEKLRPSKAVLAPKDWLKVHPTRWLPLAAGFFFGFTLLSTVLSGSFTTSMWGEIPGQDGYSAYTMASYGILFGAIATHLKTPAQMGRLLGAMVLMGVLVGLYGILQHYGHDFFNVTEITGGGTARVTIFMGNTIFAAAVLSMTVPVTLVAAAINFHYETWGNWAPLSKFGQLGRDCLATSLWALLLSVQLLGLMFTFSRGPWGGAVLALFVFLSLVLLSLGWRVLIRTGLVLALAGVLSVALLHWQGSVSIVNIGPWLGFAVALLGFAGAFAVLFVVRKYGWAIVLLGAVGVAVVIVGASVFTPSALSGRGSAGSTSASSGEGSTASQISGRITSIKTEVLGGFVGGRGTHWKVSWTLIKDRPWFEFDDLRLSWLRSLIGYGPDLFRYTYLLESPSEGPDRRPLEPDHAHNFFIHQTVEQGIFGGLASLALFASVFGVVGHHMLRRRQAGNPVYRLLLFGLMAIIIGRFLEMMVGVARISDLTVLWVIFGLFAALLSFDGGRQDEDIPAATQLTQNTGRRSRRRAARDSRASAARSFSTGLMIRLAMVAWLAGGIGVVTWQKSLNSVRAAVAEGQALDYFQKGDLESTVEELDKAIKLAPGVPSYYNNLAQVYLAYQLRPEVFTEPGCNQQTDRPYLVCLGIQSLESNLESVNRQKFNYRSWLAAGNSAFNLQLIDLALESYANAVSMVPLAWSMKNDLAESQIDAGLYDKALAELELSLEITGNLPISVRSLSLKGRALKELGRFDEALMTLRLAISLEYNSRTGQRNNSPLAQTNLDLIREINALQENALDIDYFNTLISRNPNDAVGYYNRGLAHLAMGNYQEANLDLEKTFSLGLRLAETDAHRGYARLKVGDLRGANQELTLALEISPRNALFNAYFGEFQVSQGNHAEALNYLENANILNPDLGLAYLIRGKLYMSLGLQESAAEVFDSSIGLDLPTAQDYVDRGEILAFFGEYDLAFSDLDEAIRINPNQAKYYNARAKAYAAISDFEAAVADFNAAILIGPSTSEYFLNRGVIYHLIGESRSSLADFENAESLGDVDVPPPDDRNLSYFAAYKPTGEGSRMRLDLLTERQALRDIEYYSAAILDDPTDQDALLILGAAYLYLEMLEAATVNLSQLINLSPANAEAYRNRGDAYLALMNYEAATSDYRQAVVLDPLNSGNFVARGRGYAGIGQYSLARDDFDEAIQIDSDSPDAYKFRGYLSVQDGNPSMAFPDINQAIRISPLDGDAYFKRASAYIGLGQSSLALEDLDRAIKLAPINSDYLYRRGLLHLDSERYDLALEDFDAAIGLREGYAYVDPRHAKPLFSRGKEYMRLGSPDQALVDAQTVVQLLANKFDSSAWDNRRPAINLQIADAYELLGDVYTELGKLEDAEVNYRRASRFR